MIDVFMRSPLPNTLAVVVLIALIITWFTSIVLSLRNVSVETDRGRFATLLPIFSILGLPAAFDLLQTSGITILFAGIILVIFLLNILVPILRIFRKSSNPFVANWYKWSVPISAIGGLVVAGYLTFVESTGTEAVCGPSGGCATVQSSRFAILFGILPIGILGLIGYVAILVAWLVWQFGPDTTKKVASLAIWGMGVFGVLFSIYLTFLEPFVIGATCMWCIASAVFMITLLLVSTPGAQQALAIADDESDLETA